MLNKNEIVVGNVLVLVDFSEYSKAALNAAFQWSRATGSTLHVHHHVEPILPGMTPPEFKESWQKGAEEEAATEVRDLLAGLPGMDVDNVQVHITGGKILPRLLELTGKINFDIIFIGSKGRGALSDILLGSVVSKVISNLPVPVAAISGDYRLSDGFDIFVSVNVRHDFHREQLTGLLSPLGSALRSLELITIVEPGDKDETAAADEKLAGISQACAGLAHCRHTVLQGDNVYDELVRLMEERPNSMIVVQRGDSDNVKNVIGRSLVYEIIRHQEIPVIILP
jgi:nucleotide-binding universal stress UspA family protein